MIVPYLRSSSIGSYKLCPTQYFIEYNLGEKSPSGLKATLGSTVHKALETLLWKAKFSREGIDEYDDESFGKVRTKDVTVDWAIDSAFKQYQLEEPHLKLGNADFKLIKEWTYKTLEICDGYFNPENLIVIEAEKRFDIVVDKPWAHFDYELPNGERLEGQLSLKGTVDLVAEDKYDSNIYEIIDWKTGARKDWGTGKEKDYDYLMSDHQLLLYYYAFSQVYPDKQLIMTIVFINNGGPFRMVFGPEHLGKAEEMIQYMFEKIKNDVRPKQLGTWFCKSVCHFGKTKSPHNPQKTICGFYSDTVREIGYSATMANYANLAKLSVYQDGGGRKALPL